MNRLRNRLILIFLAATLLPLWLTLRTTVALVERSLDLAPMAQLDESSKSLEQVGRALYKEVGDSLRHDASEGRIVPRHLKPAEAQAFWDSDQPEQLELAGDGGSELDLYVRRSNEVLVYSRPMGVRMQDLLDRYRDARAPFDAAAGHDLRRGFSRTLLAVAALLWVAALGAMIFLAARISRPVQKLTQGLGRVAAGDLAARVEGGGSDEIGAAVDAFNRMARQLQQARERLILVTRLASWQAVARKMAHEVKNSLTPIRLTMEEIASRRGETDRVFLEQASQIVIDEVQTLERRVRAFSEFAAEPPVMPSDVDVNALVEERIAFLKLCASRSRVQSAPGAG